MVRAAAAARVTQGSPAASPRRNRDGPRRRAPPSPPPRPPRPGRRGRARVGVRAEVRRQIPSASRHSRQNARGGHELRARIPDRPEVYAAWGELLRAIKANMDLRRYELATLAAAQRLRSSYCSLAHGQVLLDQYGKQVRAIATDRDAAGSTRSTSPSWISRSEWSTTPPRSGRRPAAAARPGAHRRRDHGRDPRGRRALLLDEDPRLPRRRARRELHRDRARDPEVLVDGRPIAKKSPLDFRLQVHLIPP